MLHKARPAQESGKARNDPCLNNLCHTEALAYAGSVERRPSRGANHVEDVCVTGRDRHPKWTNASPSDVPGERPSEEERVQYSVTVITRKTLDYMPRHEASRSGVVLGSNVMRNMTRSPGKMSEQTLQDKSAISM